MPMRSSKKETSTTGTPPPGCNRNRTELKIGVSESGNTVVDPASGSSGTMAVKARGNAPRGGVWMGQARHDSSHV